MKQYEFDPALSSAGIPKSIVAPQVAGCRQKFQAMHMGKFMLKIMQTNTMFNLSLHATVYDIDLVPRSLPWELPKRISHLFLLSLKKWFQMSGVMWWVIPFTFGLKQIP